MLLTKLAENYKISLSAVENIVKRRDEYESDYDYHYGYRTQYEEDTTPSMKDISTGWLLTLLVNINIKSAKPILDEWYW